MAVNDKNKKGKKGSRGKKGRMTEAEEDAQMLKSAQSKRRVIRLEKQPSILADHCRMHGYQLEGLNWLVKLHCNGINGILADEVWFTHTFACKKGTRKYFLFRKSISNSACMLPFSYALTIDGIGKNITNNFLFGISS